MLGRCFNRPRLNALRDSRPHGEGESFAVPLKIRAPGLAGRTLRLVKSVNGIGRRTTSFREQFIENVVGRVAPGLQQILLGKFQPRLAFHVGFDGHAHMGFFRQRQRRAQKEFAVFVNGLDRRCHKAIVAGNGIAARGKFAPIVHPKMNSGKEFPSACI